eukprot:9079907-Lingulodinium_polyedra.AAC.1
MRGIGGTCATACGRQQCFGQFLACAVGVGNRRQRGFAAETTPPARALDRRNFCKAQRAYKHRLPNARAPANWRVLAPAC